MGEDRPRRGVAQRTQLTRTCPGEADTGSPTRTCANRSKTTGDQTHHQRSGAFFGRRKGHTLRPRQAALIENLLPRLAVDLAALPPRPLAALFARPAEVVNLEIGFGGGEHLAAQAQAQPAAGFIGCEPFVNGMAKALALIEARGLDNIRLHFGDATELVAWLPASSLARVDLLYPDPWPKRRHWKRRFVQTASIAALARVLRPGGEIRRAHV